jgi:hypothetical protein
LKEIAGRIPHGEERVSNHEAPISASSFETPLMRILRMR